MQSGKPNTTDLDAIDLSDRTNRRVLWAALWAMRDVHAPQDNLSKQEWERAEHLLYQLDNLENLDV